MKKLFSLAFVALLFTGCASVKTPVVGMLYTNIKDGLAITNNSGSSKVGTAEVKGYIGLISTGDASIQTAAKEAGITRIHHVDYHSLSYIGIYNCYTVIVYGE